MPNETRRPTTASLSRRRLIAAGGGLLVAGGSALAIAPDRTAADVQLGEWSVDGTEATVEDAPQAIHVAASGRFEVSRPTTPEMCDVTLQIDVDGQVDDLDTTALYDTKTGEFSFESVDLYSHRDVERGDLTPDSAGATATVPVGIRR
jgi:hypothetical protein